MGVRNLPLIAERLIAAGRRADEPTAVVERGTYPGQRTVVDTLGGIAERARRRDIRPPSITLIGEVAALHGTIGWLERRPLHGQVVAVTRARAQASGLAARLRELGAEVVETPAILIEARELAGRLLEAVSRIRDYALICLTSPNGVSLLFRRSARPAATPARWPAPRSPRSGRAQPRSSPGAGSCRHRAGAVRGGRPDRGARRDCPLEGRRVLVARAAEARDVLPEALRARGAPRWTTWRVYETVPESLGEARSRTWSAPPT